MTTKLSPSMPNRRETASFTTSRGKTIACIPGYREAHPSWKQTNLFGPTPFGIDGFIKDVYQYALMIDFLEGLGVRTAWDKALDVGGAEGTLSRLLRGEGRARWVATLEVQDLKRRLSTAMFLRYLTRFQLAVAASRFNPKLRQFLLGERTWRGRRLSPLYADFGYAPPRGSTFWRVWLRTLPRLDRYLIGDFYQLKEPFDLITSVAALPYFDVEKMFAKVSELLPEGGIFFFLNDNWWFPVNSTLLVGHFPYVGQRLTEPDLCRYVEEFHPGELDDWMARYRYYHHGKEKPTLDGYVEIADRFDLELLGAQRLIPPHLSHFRAVVSPKLLNQCDDTRLRDILEEIQQARPDVGLIDLMTRFYMAAFVKRTRRRVRLTQSLDQMAGGRKSHSNGECTR